MRRRLSSNNIKEYLKTDEMFFIANFQLVSS